MHKSAQDNPINQSRKSGIVIAALGLQLLLCSIATAANAAGDSIDRSARRLPAQVAQALREIVDRSSAQPTDANYHEDTPGYNLGDTPIRSASIAPEHPARVRYDLWSRRTLNLPPPTQF